MPLTSKPPALKSKGALLAFEPPEVIEEFLSELSDNALLALPYLFEYWALPHQFPPEGDWRTWVIMGGRGAGKTRAGAEWVRGHAEGSTPSDKGRATRIALVGETYDQAREVMVFGESGILACCPPDRKPKWVATRRRLEWPNGATAQIFSASEPEALRGPQFDLAWVDELGCPAIDKGANQPNVFVDKKSSESAAPYFSVGTRDDLIQHQYLTAQLEYWRDESNNPLSVHYAGPMVDLEHAHVWAWDARPWPAFPNRSDIWSDGENYQTGHWLTGRTTGLSLARVIAEICEQNGLADYDVSEVYGLVRGYKQQDYSSARSDLQPLMLAYGFHAFERDGVIVFKTNHARPDFEIDDSIIALESLDAAARTASRDPMAEIPGRLRIEYIRETGDFDAGVVEVSSPLDGGSAVEVSELPLVLTRGQASQIASRWLAEASVARDKLKIAVPPSRPDIGAGDVVCLNSDDGTQVFRIDRVEDGGARVLECSRVEAGVYGIGDLTEPRARVAEFIPPIPVHPIFLDLRLITGSEVPHAPRIAVSGTPWPGSAAIYAANADYGYTLNSLVDVGATIGETETDFEAAKGSLWQRDVKLRVKVFGGELSSASSGDVLNGANIAAIANEETGKWELFQFQLATIVGQSTYELSGFLRGQFGTEFQIEGPWPVGSRFVLINNAVVQLQMLEAERGLAKHYRIGTAKRPYDDPIYVHSIEAFSGNGLRPYSPVHLTAAHLSDGSTDISWIRRARLNHDSWLGEDIPLGEASERYRVHILVAGLKIRSETVSSQSWNYSVLAKTEDGNPSNYEVEVAQLSESFGAGIFERIDANE
jgi:hypothetical protein